jgi:hypothetical protein
MQMPGIPDSLNDVMEQFMGLIHFAVSVGSDEKVNTLTEQLRDRMVLQLLGNRAEQEMGIMRV